MKLPSLPGAGGLVLLAVLGASCGREPPPPPSARVSPTQAPPVDSGVVAASAAGVDDAAIAAAAQRYLDLLVAISPESATSLGLHARDSELDARDPQAFARALADEEALLAELDARFASPTASPSSLTDLALLRGMLRVDIARRRVSRPLEREPQLYTSPLGAIFSMTAREYAPPAERARNVLARLEKIPSVVAHAKKNLKEPPRVWTQVAIERAGGAKAFFAGQRAFLDRSLPGGEARVSAALEKATSAYEDYRAFLQKTVLPRSSGKYAAGKEHFELLLREGYFVSESADALASMGEKIFAETDAQMAAVARKIDPRAKGWPEVVARVKGNHPRADELLESYRFEVKRARDFLARLDVVPFPEGDDLQVIDTPEFMRSTVTAAYDQPPPFDGATRGFFFVTPVNRALSPKKQEEMLRENDHGDIVDTAVHEAYPGHHLQLSFAAKNPSRIRKAYDAAIFSEGWALYSEELMSELGYYTDEERLMQLEWTLVRAARIVLDVGLHTRGMSYEEAVKFLTDKVHLEHELAVSEVKRYTMHPTQPLAYLTGRQAILKLRDRYRARAGGAYSLKAFHTELLVRGTVPVGLTEREIFGNPE